MASNGIDVTDFTVATQATVTDYPGPFVLPILVAPVNPQRAFLLVFFSNTTGRVSPAPGSQVYGWGADVGTATGGRLLHRAALPAMVEGEWYFYDSGGGGCRVYDVETG